jgi:tetratricopeptide (TPR) repeat protein
MNSLSSAQIRKWYEAGLAGRVDLGLSIEDANREAERCWGEMLDGNDASRVLADDVALPDVLHALGRLLEDSGEVSSGAALAATTGLYDFASGDSKWSAVADERHVLSAAFAYVAWRCCRRMALWREARIWESRCEQHVVREDDASEYLRLGAVDRGRTAPRFLRDRATLLVACRQLRRLANEDPAESVHFAIVAYRWVTGEMEAADEEERSFFAGELALAAAGALRLARRYVESEPWFQAASQWFSKTVIPAPLMARVGLNVAACLHNRLNLEESLTRLPLLIRTFREFGMEEDLRKCQLLEGMVLKDMGRTREAITRLTNLAAGAPVSDDPLVYGVALAQLGEAYASVGAMEDARRSFAQAIPLIEEAKVPWAMADCQAMLAEALRDQGNLEDALPLYRSAVHVNLAMRLDGRAAYLRILLAEALLMSGREKEAANEIVAALPIFGREGLAPAAAVAVALLHESLRRQKADPEALRELCIELKKMKESAQS